MTAVTASPTATPDAEPQSDVPAWSSFTGSARLQEWSAELAKACGISVEDYGIWDLVGHAALIVCTHEPTCAAIAERVALDAGMRFLLIDATADLEVVPSTVLEPLAPALVYLRPGSWMHETEEKEDPDVTSAKREVRERLIDWMQSFDPAHPVVIVTSAEEICTLHKSLRHVGRIDRFFAIPAPTLEQQGDAFIDRIGRNLCGDSMLKSVKKVGMLVTQRYEEDRRKELAVLRIHRLIAREKRDVEFLDILNLSQHGFAEVDTAIDQVESNRRTIAYHEAGHAVVAILDSNGANIPEYATIVSSSDFKGVVVRSLGYEIAHSEIETYAEMRHTVRVALAGRGAEEVVFGAEQVTSGSRGDLRVATLSAGNGFAHLGYAPSIEKPGQSRSNLMLIGIDGADFSPSEQMHVEGLIRSFLATEYDLVIEMLAKHRPLLDAIAERLLRDLILDQDALKALLAAAGYTFESTAQRV
jgi:cell division protease FtsH